jgi:RimJ/RimL family protein N-acetyltransferase
MNHSISAEGFSVRLRPVRNSDAAFIVWVRNLDHARGRIGDSARDPASQEAWLAKYFERAGDYYFIIETLGGTQLGAYGIYDQTGDSAESGRWVIRPGVPAAVPSAVLAFDIAFDSLGLQSLRSKTVSTNRTVLSLNRKLGFEETRLEPKAQVIDGIAVDMVHFVLSRDNWRKTREKVLPLAQLAEKQVAEWETGHPASKNEFC